jgi:hypothetical protein
MTGHLTRPRLSALLAVALVACGGNYSNEDLEFQAALPARSNLEVHPPSNLVVADAAEYYKLTRDVIVQLDAIVATVVAWVDVVRGTPASSRSEGQRIWGPFPVKEHPGWEMRVTMTKLSEADAPLGFRLDYDFGVRRADAAAAEPWITFLFGTHRPGGVALASGSFHIVTAALRAAGYPVDDPADPNDLNDILVIDAAFERDGNAFHNVVDVQTVGPASPTAHYEYAVAADRSGSLRFAIDREALTIQQLTVVSRWLADGAGRADAKVTAGLFSSTDRLGVDCWATNTRATYVQRDWDPAQNHGDPATCVLPAATF